MFFVAWGNLRESGGNGALRRKVVDMLTMNGLDGVSRVPLYGIKSSILKCN